MYTSGFFDPGAIVFVLLAAVRVGSNLVGGDELPAEIWRRRWLEVIGLVTVAILLFAVSRVHV
jgi:hypothetical protein